MCLNDVSTPVPLPFGRAYKNRDLDRRANEIAIYEGSDLRIATFFFVFFWQLNPLDLDWAFVETDAFFVCKIKVWYVMILP